MFKEYWDSFDCEINPEEFEDWYAELDEENVYCNNLENILLIDEEDVPFQEKNNG